MARGFGATLGVGTTDNIVIPYTGIGTINSFFIRYNIRAAGGSAQGYLFSKATAGLPTDIVSLNYTGGFMQFQRAWTNIGAWVISAAGVTFSTNYNMLITYDGSLAANKPLMYVNAVSQPVTTNVLPTGSLSSSAATYTIGNAGAIVTKDWDGVISEFAIWNRLLSQDEATALNKGLSPIFLGNGLQSYTPLLSPYYDLLNGPSTITGTKNADHPPVIYKSVG